MSPPTRCSLTRTVRFVAPLPGRSTFPSTNTFAASPAVDGLGVFVSFAVRAVGVPDPTTGYLVDIGAVDRAVRDAVAPLVTDAVAAAVPPGTVLRRALPALEGLPGDVDAVRWDLTPFLSLEMESACMDRVLLRQSFEFAAAHRLHCPSLSDARNREVFGKCNNPSGHGHNYRVEVAVSVPLAADGGLELGLPGIESIVRERVIDRFDHRHLNLDTAEFAERNPSVENIAAVCHGLLADPIADAGGDLRTVTVWETEKTCCTYPA